MLQFEAAFVSVSYMEFDFKVTLNKDYTILFYKTYLLLLV